MPRIAVVDDQPDMRQQLCSMIDQYSRENNCMLEVTAFSDGAQVITNYCKGFDIIFLDIEMPELGGMDAAERIRTVDPDVVLVFDDHAEILDYKTDKSRNATYYIESYAAQLRLYRRAFALRLPVPVTKLTIYSFAMQDEIDIPLEYAAFGIGDKLLGR